MSSTLASDAATTGTPAGPSAPARRWWRPGRRLFVIESVVMLAIGALLAAASVHDVSRQIGLDKRQIVDRRTFRAYVHRPKLKKIGITPGTHSTVDKVCGQDATRSVRRVCLLLGGSSHVKYRMIRGGYYVPLTKPDLYRFRSGCFGYAQRRRLCGAPPLTS